MLIQIRENSPFSLSHEDISIRWTSHTESMLEFSTVAVASWWTWGEFLSCWRHQMETFSALLAICAGNSSVPVMFSLICIWINRWVNNGEADDLRRYRAHYDVIVMFIGKHVTICQHVETSKVLYSLKTEMVPTRSSLMTPDNHWCYHWWQSWHHDDSRLSIFDSRILNTLDEVHAHVYANHSHKTGFTVSILMLTGAHVYTQFHWKSRNVMMPTLWSLAAPQLVVMTSKLAL